jgi:Mn-dependent DtxR family transcriptional regulator
MNKNQHIQLPNRKENEDVSPREQLVYLALKSFMNKDTKESFPSLQKISELLDISIPTLRKDIKHLEDLDYIKIIKKGKNQIYRFNDYKTFEVFSYDFLYNKDLTSTEKAYLVATQQYMFKTQETGSVSFSNNALSNLIHMPESTVSKCNRSLENKNLLTIVDNRNRDDLGLMAQTKIFKLAEFNEAVVNTLVNHEDRLSQLEKQNQLLMAEINRLKGLQQEEIIL